MNVRNLIAKGQGIYDYDFKNDILMFKIKDREYKTSIDFENMILDMDSEDFITGIRIFDVSKIFKLEKEALRNVKEFEFHTNVENKVIKIQLRFTSILRNKPIIKQGQDFERTLVESNINDSEVLCTVA